MLKKTKDFINIFVYCLILISAIIGAFWSLACIIGVVTTISAKILLESVALCICLSAIAGCIFIVFK